jgi:hypothetical protein
MAKNSLTRPSAHSSPDGIGSASAPCVGQTHSTVRHLIRVGLSLLLAVAGATSVIGSGASGSASAEGNRLGDIITRYYTMAMRMRPFGVWIARENIGGARLSWNASPGPDTRLELLVGSDPEHAPMALNRWGFIAERTLDGTTRQTSLMTEIDERSITATLNGVAVPKHGHAFRAVESTIRGNEVTTATARLVLDRDLTYRYYTTLLDRLPSGSGTDPVQRVSVGTGTEPGFLAAVKDLMHESVTGWQRDGRIGPGAARRDFVHLGTVYRMTLRHATVVNDEVVSGGSHGPAMDGEFEVRNPATGVVSEFHLVYGLKGADAESPLRVVYRPHWWVELELRLLDPGTSKFAMSAIPPPLGSVR